MATTWTARAGLAQPASLDRGWDAPLLATIASLDGTNAIGALAVTLHEFPSSTLAVKVAAGTFISSTYAYVVYAGVSSLAIAASSTLNVWLTDSGTLTTGASWPTSGTKHVRLATVVSGVAAITSITDARIAAFSAG